MVRTIEFGDALQEYGNGGRNAATLFALVGGASAKNGDVRPVEKVVEAWPAVWSPFGTLAMTMGTVVSFASAAKPFMESLVVGRVEWGRDSFPCHITPARSNYVPLS